MPAARRPASRTARAGTAAGGPGRGGRRHLLPAGMVLAGLLMGGCAPEPPEASAVSSGPASASTTAPSPAPRSPEAEHSTPRDPTPSSAGGVAAGTARAALASLPVKGRAPATGYDRARFGQRWADVDRNGCDTRNDVLRRDLVDVVVKAGTGGCRVLSGTLHGPYTGRTIAFTAGPGTSEDVQIDHVVSLSDAWQTGAQSLPADRREQLANDPLNLLAVDGPVNQAKSDGDAATWLPPVRDAWCPMVARQIAVKARYGLWVTAPEHDAMVRVLDDCPDQPLPSEAGAQPPAPGTGTTAQREPASAPASGSAAGTPADPVEPGSAGSPASFTSCSAARAAGAAPLRRGEPGYRAAMDGDGDGVACE